MGLPGFGAVGSLYQRSGHYYAAAIWGGSFVGPEHGTGPLAGRPSRHQFLSEGRLQLSQATCVPNPCDGGECCHDSKGHFKGCCGGSCCYDANGDASACAGEGQFCCGGLSCFKGQELCCTGGCVALDEHNCGRCGNECSDNEECCSHISIKGAMSYSCADTATDKNNCGNCDHPCSGGQLCCKGSCVAEDLNNCGTCGNQCGLDQYCVQGACSNCPLAPECGNQCYNPRDQKCCFAAINPHVCDLDSDCTSAGCCGITEHSCTFYCAPLGAECCPNTTERWCPPGFHCCDTHCCPAGQECCPVLGCCPA